MDGIGGTVLVLKDDSVSCSCLGVSHSNTFQITIPSNGADIYTLQMCLRVFVPSYPHIISKIYFLKSLQTGTKLERVEQ